MELLERRQLLAVTVQRTTLNLRFSTDLKPNEAAYGEYQSFKITNTGPTALSDVWVRATNFSPTQKVQLGVGEDGNYFLGDLGVGAANAETAFIYMVAEQITSPPALDPQNFTIEVWRGQPAAPGSTLVTTQNDLFQWVGEAIQDDSSSRTFSVNVGYAYGGAPTTTPIVGGTMTMTVTGDIKNKPDRILFSPASTLAWPADAFVLEDAVVTYSKNPQLPPDTIFEKPIASKPKDFTVVYTFRIAQPTATATPVTPVQYTANGVQDLQSRKFDHSKILEGVADIPPATFPLADLQIEKRDFVQTYTPGLPITWRITVTNNGPNPVTGARVTDLFPAQVSGVSWTAVFAGGSGNPSGTGNINELVNLAVGGTAVYTVNVTTFSTATGNLSNTASVIAPAGITDPNLSNNSWTDIDLPAPVADLRVTKVDGSPTYVPGLATTYTVTVTNGGPSFVTGARVVDTFSPLFTGVTWTAAFAGTGSSGAASGSGSINQVVNLAAGGTATYTVVATVASTATTQIVNTASVTAPDGTTDPNLANNSATDTNQAAPRVNLGITKTDGTGTYVPGQTLTYVVTVTNSGPSLLTGGRVVDALPATIVGATWSASYTGSGSSGTGSGTGSVDATFNLAVGGVATITILAPVVSTATGNLVNTATVTVPVGTTNTNPVNSATDTDTPAPIADLRASKTDGKSRYTPGTTTTYTVQVVNGGPSAVTAARVVDTLSPLIVGATWTASFTGGSGATSGSGPINQLVNLGAGGFVTYTIVAPIRPTASGNLVNTVVASVPAGTTDPNPLNNTATDIDTIDPSVDLVIAKANGAPTYTAGLPLVYTVTVTNASDVAVTAARVQDTFPSATFSSVSWTAAFTGGTGNASGSGNVLNELVNLTAGGRVVYTITTAVRSTVTGNLSNTATVTPPAGVLDPNPDNNTSTHVDLPAPVADLRVTKVDGSPTYVPGLATTYTVTVTNAGPSFVTGARVVDTFSPLFTGVTWTAVFAGTGSSGIGGGSGSINQVVNLAAGGTATYTVVATVASTATTQIVNTASVTAPDGTTDPNLANNSATDTNQAAPRVNLGITKTDGTGTYVPGQTLTYVVTVTNSGPSLLTGGRVVDALPATIVGATWSASYTGSGSSGTGSGTGSVDATFNLAVGGVATITILAPVVSTATGNLVNTATVTVPVGTTNTNPVNSATDTDTPTPLADLRSFKTDGTSTFFPGTTLNYTITVSNFGPSAAFNARFTDTFDPTMFDVANVRWTMRFPNGSTRTGVGNIDQIFDIDRGNAERVITITVSAPVRATAPREISNTSLVMPAADTTDYNLTNNQSTDVDVEGSRNGLVTGTDDGCPSAPFVRVLDPDTGAVQSEFIAYEPAFRGGVRVAAADLNGDGFDEILTAPGRGRVGEIRVWTQAGSRLGSFTLLPFGVGYVGGVEITTGDFNGDGRTDIAAAMSAGTGTVNVFLANGPSMSQPVYQLWRSFVPFPGRYTGGVTIAAADFGTFANGRKTLPTSDLKDELVVGSNAGMVATVNVYDLSVKPLVVGSMRPIASGFTGGVTLSIGRWNADAIPDILVGAGIGGRSVVDIYSGATFQRLALLQAFSSFAKPNARVFATSLDTDGDGVIDRVFAVQGLQGIAGTRGVTVWNRATGGTAVLPGSTGLIPPLRITNMTKRGL